MDEEQIKALVRQFDTTRSSGIEAAWSKLRPLGGAMVPFLADAYPTTRKWQGRCALVFYAIPYARVTDEAFRLGLTACNDGASHVRYRACMLLAYSLRREAIPRLENLLRHKDPATVEHAAAALDAITHHDHHLFVDRDHSGRVHWEIAGDPTTVVSSPAPELLEEPRRSWWKVWRRGG